MPTHKPFREAMVGENRKGFYSSILATGNAVRVDPIKSESAVYLRTLKLGGTANGRFVPLLG